MLNEFIDEHAKKLTPYDQAVYMALCRHVNGNGETFVSARTIAIKMGINKNTVSNSIKHLKLYNLVIQLKGGERKKSTLKIVNVSFKDSQLSCPVIHKEEIKEEKKEALFAQQKRTPEEQERINQRLEEMRNSLINKLALNKKYE